MFWNKEEKPAGDESVTERVAIEAEGFFRSGKMHCAEAVLLAIRNAFRPEVPATVVEVASGFGGGSGTGCLCGAVAGGTMALGLVLPEEKRRVKRLTQDLHHWFKGEYGAVCCRVVLQRNGKACAELTGKVAGKVAELLS
ncbi:MAG TPA: C-GCAxxG-C-C family protein [Geobacteraceae bacterium]|jgi:C_GCAxxG_C_C family probable redox protein|nr:C-GCAxxG-C-C family protein [Geobacteraceae bacterium]